MKVDSNIVGTDGSDKLLPNFTELETKILVASLEGGSTKQIAAMLRVPPTFIRTFLNKGKVKEYLREQKELAAELVQLKIQELLTGVVEQRIEEADGDMSKITKKDTLEVIKVLQDISSGIVKGAQKSESEDKYAAILGLVMKDED